MVLSKHVRHCRKCVSVTRQLTEGATQRNGTDNSTALATRMSRSLSIIQKTKMSLQNQWKLLSQLKGPGKSDYDKNLQFILSKEWIDLIQKVTYAQIDNLRKFSATKNLNERSDDGDAASKKDTTTDKVVAIALSPEEKVKETQTVANSAAKKVAQVKTSLQNDIKEQFYSFPQVLAALLPQLNTRNVKEVVIPAKPKWKTNIQTNITKHSIASRTRHVLNSIATAESSASKWRRIEDLLTHIEQYPEARHYAIKEGAISILLRTRQKIKDPQIHGSIREALAVMGHVDPLPGRGIRILSIDGGGMRGLVVIEMLKKLEELTGHKIHEMFDYMCGVSTGAILSASLGGLKRKTLNEISDVYKTMSTKIFTRSTIRGTSNLVWSHAYYDTELWEQMLQEQLGDKDLMKTARDLNSPKFSVVSTVLNHSQMMAYLFRNYTLPHRVESQYMGGHRYKLWQAVRASAAAPTYFEEFKHGEYLFTDGGLMVNNPCAVAIHEAKQLWPNNPIQCVVSFGTGRTPTTICGSDTEAKEITFSSWKEKFHTILASATDTEAVHTMLNDLLPDHAYYRFNPYLTEMVPMEEIRPEKIEQLEQDAMMYIRKNEDKFLQAAMALTERKRLPQKIADWLGLQKKILGF